MVWTLCVSPVYGRSGQKNSSNGEDLPLTASEGVQVERIVGPRVLQLQLDHRVHRVLPVAVRIQGAPGAEPSSWGAPIVTPAFVTVTGPEAAFAHLDSVVLGAIRIDGRRDTVRAQVRPHALPDWCSANPASVNVRIPIRHAAR